MRLALLLVLLLELCAACESSGPAADSAACVEATQHADLQWIQVHVFDVSCRFSACHGADSGGSTGRQDLSDGAAIASLVNRPSKLVDGATLVIPHDAAHSYLMVMLGSVPGTIPAKDTRGHALGTMPLRARGGRLCQQKRDAIARWIDAGARDD